MSGDKIAIVCDGKEIAYGTNLSHLFNFESNQLNIRIASKSGCEVELYSQAVFRHSGISKKTVKVYVGAASMPDANYATVYNEYGMMIKRCENQFMIDASDAALSGKIYDNFIAYANKRRNEYLDVEKAYADEVRQYSETWISRAFEKQSPMGLLRQKQESKIKRQQQFDCLSYIMYLDFLVVYGG